ncbi:hypothetical protein LZ30DRAFT_405304 [Colletotrichum cereale]|nr:hypothetical protein LZ30DRAFT_405304 [Colletotrichum cereale]
MANSGYILRIQNMMNMWERGWVEEKRQWEKSRKTTMTSWASLVWGRGARSSISSACQLGLSWYWKGGILFLACLLPCRTSTNSNYTVHGPDDRWALGKGWRGMIFGVGAVFLVHILGGRRIKRHDRRHGQMAFRWAKPVAFLFLGYIP